MEIYVAGVVVWVFFCFAFVAEQLNPFAKPKNHVRRAQLRYGRRVALAALVCGLVLLALVQFTLLPIPLILTTCMTCFAILWYFIARFLRSDEAY